MTTIRTLARGTTIVVAQGTPLYRVFGGAVAQATTRYVPIDDEPTFAAVFIGMQTSATRKRKMAHLRREDLSIVAVEAKALKNLEVRS